MKGVEALVRWRHPERGTVPPGSFIPLAEESGLIVPLAPGSSGRPAPGGGVAAALAGPIVDEYQPVGGPDRPSRSPRARGPGARRLRIEPGLVVLEITETAVMTDPDRALKRLAELKSLGVRLAIDDFGTGYSSLNYVSRFRSTS